MCKKNQDNLEEFIEIPEERLLTESEINSAIKLIDKLSNKNEMVLSINEKSFHEDKITL